MDINDNNAAYFPVGVPLGASGTDMNNQQFGMLKTLGGSSEAAQQAMAFANQLYPSTPKADPWEAAFQFFAEMGRQASVPGSTALGAAASSLQAPMDYLAAKKKEKRETDRARVSAAAQLAPSLKAPVVNVDYTDVTVDGVPQVMTDAEITAAKDEGKVVSPYNKPSTNTTSFKERKFYKTGFPAAVVKNETDAALFEAGGWSAVPPEGWSESVDGGGFETQSSEIISGGIVVFAGKDGSVKVVRSSDGATLTGDEADDAIDEAYAKGVEIQGDRSQSRGFGSEAAKIVTKSYEDMLKIRNNISTLEDAKRALESGAVTGFFQQFLPDISRSATELANVRQRLGLDVVSSVTFGALSEAELNMALDTGLPTNMDEDYLKGWVQKRIDAKKKLLLNLQEAAKFLSKGNSIGDWIVELDKRETTQQEEITPLATEISTMSKEDMLGVDVNSLTNAELKAYLKRKDELN